MEDPLKERVHDEENKLFEPLTLWLLIGLLQLSHTAIEQSVEKLADFAARIGT